VAPARSLVALPTSTSLQARPSLGRRRLLKRSRMAQGPSRSP